jgi:hypothetical protein
MSRYFNYTGDDYVAHFGVKGMKWGIRRYQNNDGSLTTTGKTRYSRKRTKKTLSNEDIIKNADARTIEENISRLSTKELNEATMRANMKRQLGDISKVEKTRGRRAAMEVIRDFATITAAASGAIALGYRMNKVHKDIFANAAKSSGSGNSMLPATIK